MRATQDLAPLFNKGPRRVYLAFCCVMIIDAVCSIAIYPDWSQVDAATAVMLVVTATQVAFYSWAWLNVHKYLTRGQIAVLGAITLQVIDYAGIVWWWMSHPPNVEQISLSTIQCVLILLFLWSCKLDLAALASLDEVIHHGR